MLPWPDRPADGAGVAPAGRHTPFIGRACEFSDLTERLGQAALGRGSVVLLAGDGGIGKSRLAEELAAHASERGASVLWGRCYEGDGAPAFWPWTGVLRAAAGNIAPDLLRAALGHGIDDLVQLAPDLRERVPGASSRAHQAALRRLRDRAVEPAEARFQLFESVTSFLLALARASSTFHVPRSRTGATSDGTRSVERGTPPSGLVLILDDLHWADQPSLLLLEFFARQIAEAPVLLVGTYRDAEVNRGDRLAVTLGALTRLPHVARVFLGGLPPSDVAGWVGQAAGDAVPPETLETLVRKTEGNPLFITEMLRLLTADAANQPDGPESRLPVPETIRDVIGRRLSRLSLPCNEMLTIAAVAGREFDLAVLEAVGAGAEGGALVSDDLLIAIEEAETARIIAAVSETPGRYRFTHALIGETLYDDLPAVRRMRLHRRTGEALAGWYAGRTEAPWAELAAHFFRALPTGDPLAAADYARRAAAHAATVLAYEEAVRLHEMALQALDFSREPADLLRCDTLLDLAELRHSAGDGHAAREACTLAATIARRLELPDRLARAALAYGGHGITLAWRNPTLTALLDGAIRALDESDGPLRARLMARYAQTLIVEQDEHRRDQVRRRAVAIARGCDDPETRAYTLAAWWWTLNVDQSEECLTLATEIVRLAESMGDVQLFLDALRWTLMEQLSLGHVEAFHASVDRYETRARELRLPYHIWYATVLRATQACIKGDLAESERLAQAAVERVSPEKHAEAHAYLFIQRAAVAAQRGRSAELAPQFRALADANPQTPAWRAALAYHLATSGQLTEARREFERLATAGFHTMPRYNGYLAALSHLEDVCVALGDRERAAELYDLLLPFARHHVIGGAAALCRGAAARSLGALATLLGRWDDAAAHFETALEMNERLGARVWLARTRCEYAAMLLARANPADRPRAQDLLAEALTTATELDLTPVIERCRALADPTPRPNLTPRPPSLAGKGVPEPGRDAHHLGVGPNPRTSAAQPAQGTPFPAREGGRGVRLGRGVGSALTTRELEVLSLLAAGRTNKEIAELLVLSPATVRRHTINIYAKIEARGRTEAAAYAFRHGIAPAASPA